jgi:GST-like protein
MIDAYFWPTSNGLKLSVMLEETALPYKIRPINITRNDQFTPEFIAINPNSKIPAIVDPDGPAGKPITLFESGAILIYLADKTGKFLSKEPHARYTTLQWLMFQMGGVGPIFGQAHHFLKFAKEDVPYGKKRYGDETKRLYSVMDLRLGQTPFLAGGDYTIADIATYPWVSRFDYQQVDLATYPNVKRWFDTVSARPAVQRGMAVRP